jgi:hypothetical protein
LPDPESATSVFFRLLVVAFAFTALASSSVVFFFVLLAVVVFSAEAAFFLTEDAVRNSGSGLLAAQAGAEATRANPKTERLTVSLMKARWRNVKTASLCWWLSGANRASLHSQKPGELIKD